MHRWLRLATVGLSMTTLFIGCAPAASPRASVPEQQQGSAPAPKRMVVAASATEPSALELMIGAFGFSQFEALPVLVNSGLQIVAPDGKPRAQLSVDVPTIENGGWKVLPDGRMETTWRIRPSAAWHDGTPFTSADIAFTSQVEADRDLALFTQEQYRLIDRLDTSDPYTVTAHWRVPYIYGNLLFGFAQDRSLMPMPKHLLERHYLADKESFTRLPYWTTEYIGTGPYRLREWIAGSHLTVDANDRYVLGRPKIDTIEVRFIPDPSVLVANLLAGAVEVHFGGGLNLERAQAILQQLPGAKMDVAFLGTIAPYPQFINANPAIVTNLQFRRALLHGSDRQQMVDTFTGGLSTVAHTFIYNHEPDFKDIEPYIVKYEYDPRLAIQMIEGLGYTRASDGIFRDAAGQRLSVELRSSGGYSYAAQAIAGMWQQIGVVGEPYVVPPQLDGDAEFKSTYPAFEVVARGNFRWTLYRPLGSREAPLPENRWYGGNRGRYQNTELDDLIERYNSTITPTGQARYLGEIIRHTTENAVILHMFHNLNPTVYAGRLRNIYSKWERSTPTWNVHEWEAD